MVVVLSTTSLILAALQFYSFQFKEDSAAVSISIFIEFLTINHNFMCSMVIFSDFNLHMDMQSELLYLSDMVNSMDFIQRTT